MSRIGITKNNPKFILKIEKNDSLYIDAKGQNITGNCTNPKHKLEIKPEGDK